MPAIDIERVAMRFGEVDALRDVSLQVADGDFVTLLGPSGCGKTTLLNILAGFLAPTRGRVMFDRQDVTGIRPEARDTAMCFQSYALFPHLDVAQNIAFGPRQQRVPRAEIAARVDDLVRQMGLGPHVTKLPNALSGGQQQRVALARALAVAPGIVLFDEPLSNLDAKLRDQVRTEIRALQKRVGFTAVYVTHDQAEALAMSDTVFLLNGGVIEQSGSPREIYFRPRTRFVADFIGAANLHDGAIMGGAMQTPFGPVPIDAPDATRACLCWRPEAARLDAQGTLKGLVAASAFQGGWLDLFVMAGEQTLRLQVPGHHDIPVGTEIRFAIPRDSVVMLEDAGHA